MWFTRSCAIVICVVVGAFFFVQSSTAASNWPRWRGPDDNGSAGPGAYPARWDAQKVLWKATLPGKGCSTPIVWQEQVVLTAPSNGLNAVLAFDWSGKPLWHTTLGAEDPGKHRNGSGSNPSPATDGQSVFVYFKSGMLAALEFNGKVRWQTNLVAAYGAANLYWDFGTSPVLTGKYVVMAKMHEGDSWLAAFDKATGALTWKVARNYKTPQEGDHGYTTPQLIPHRGREALLVWGGLHLTAHDVTDGKVLWSCGDFNPQRQSMWAAVASPVVVGDIAVVPTGRNDRNQPKDRNNYYASPIVAGDLLYAIREDGLVFVATLEPAFKVVAENNMGERVIASPVALANRLLIRGEQHLFCVGD